MFMNLVRREAASGASRVHGNPKLYLWGILGRNYLLRQSASLRSPTHGPATYQTVGANIPQPKHIEERPRLHQQTSKQSHNRPRDIPDQTNTATTNPQ